MRRIVSFLREQGIKVWLDNEKLIPGTPIWEEELEKAIKSASAIIVLLSPDSKKSEWVKREIALAEEYKKRLFPILIKGDKESSIGIRLITHQYVDLRTKEKESEGLSQLSKAIIFYQEEMDEVTTVVNETTTATAKVAVVGAPSRGKSSIINVLIGKDLFPLGIYQPQPQQFYGMEPRDACV
jgi:tRNA U34 5-carboxymethylaminomethyl modifying GTPase MnmE/TrmE